MRVREFFRHFRFYFVISIITVGLLVYFRMRFNGPDYVMPHSQEHIEEFGALRFGLIVSALISFLLAILSAVVDVFVIRFLTQKKRLGTVLMIGAVVQTIALLFVFGTSSRIIQKIYSLVTGHTIERLDFETGKPLIVVLCFVVLLGKLFIEIDRKLGPGNLWKTITGRFYSPREEHRIFMFIDLKDSTAIAERIGHIKFSKLIQDVFRDLSVVAKFRTEIYQYAGDEAVVSWPIKSGLSQQNFLKAFYAYMDAINERADHYLSVYGLVPYFKAAAHMGHSIVTEVGEIKREITYHGDTLNTTARMEGLCNRLGAQLIISERLKSHIENQEGYTFEDMGEHQLKGRQEGINLIKVERKV